MGKYELGLRSCIENTNTIKVERIMKYWEDALGIDELAFWNEMINIFDENIVLLFAMQVERKMSSLSFRTSYRGEVQMNVNDIYALIKRVRT
ncbi:MAG: hypothetical protein ABI758_04475 [Candidatus Woesebacteria bacterium]